jgi:hypothetical protein
LVRVKVLAAKDNLAVSIEESLALAGCGHGEELLTDSRGAVVVLFRGKGLNRVDAN